MQKFKRGNLVKILVGHIIYRNKNGAFDLRPEDVGRLAIIDYSYAERYGGSDIDSYSIIWLDTGYSLAWKQTNELEFIDKGGDHLFLEAEANKLKSKQAILN